MGKCRKLRKTLQQHQPSREGAGGAKEFQEEAKAQKDKVLPCPEESKLSMNSSDLHPRSIWFSWILTAVSFCNSQRIPYILLSGDSIIKKENWHRWAAESPSLIISIREADPLYPGIKIQPKHQTKTPSIRNKNIKSHLSQMTRCSPFWGGSGNGYREALSLILLFLIQRPQQDATWQPWF